MPAPFVTWRRVGPLRAPPFEALIAAAERTAARRGWRRVPLAAGAVAEKSALQIRWDLAIDLIDPIAVLFVEIF